MLSVGALSRIALAISAVALSTFISSANADTPYRVWVNFHGRNGADPVGGAPTVDFAGNVYGTTNKGGAGFGVLFKIAPDRTETTLHVFGDGKGSFPEGAVLYNESNGTIFGTATGGDDYYDCKHSGCGVLYSMTPDGTYTVLHSFDGYGGAAPVGAPVQDNSGNLYGVTVSGGDPNWPCYCGTVWMQASTGAFAVLHTFVYSDGSFPYAGLFRGHRGTLYGTTGYGGDYGWGTVFKITPGGTFATLHSFDGSNNDGVPLSGLVEDAKHNLYGTTSSGGDNGVGTIYKIDPHGGYSVIHSFSSEVDGGSPQGNLVLLNGKLYGTTSSGVGAGCNCGAVFEFGTDGSETVLHIFAGAPSDGAAPQSGLASGPNGFLYGETSGGGTDGDGTVFRIKR